VAYRLGARESIGKGLKRVVGKELRSAIDALDDTEPSDEAIHEARKSIKKVRAALQLVGSEVETADALKGLRRASRLLSPVRDAKALVESAEALFDEDSHAVPPATRADVTHKLEREKTRLTQAAASDQAFTKARRSLRRVRRSMKSWKWQRVGASDLIPEIRDHYKKARRRMRRVSGAADPEAFHGWRKRIKTLWYALRLLERRVGVRRDLKALGSLETWLGDDHNLVVLRAQMSSHVSSDAQRRHANHLQQLARRRQHELRRMAIALGRRVFDDGPKRFARRLKPIR
jgi:hypothetical protein